MRALLLILLAATAHAEKIDLPSVLRLAGADSVEVRIAQERLAEARAREDGTLWQMFPVISPGVTYRNHSGQLQDIVGQVTDITKSSFGAGATLQLSLEIGESTYRRLAAKQMTLAAEHRLESERRRMLLAAAEAYFELTAAQAAADLQEDAVRLASDLHRQVSAAVAAGLAAKGDEHRAFAQLTRAQIRREQARDARRGAAARLAEVVRLPVDVDLTPADRRPVAIAVPGSDRKLDALVQTALARRPEIAEAERLDSAAQENLAGAKYAPLWPTLGAQVFGGGLGGSPSSARDDWGRSTDTQVTLSWRIGAGGLLDSSRVRAAEAAAAQGRLGIERIRDAVTREVVEAHAAVHATSAAVKSAQAGLKSAEDGLKLAAQRRDFAVGAVMETLQSQQDAVQARLEAVRSVADLNKARHRLKAAVGE
jgi:outer membrane protein/adhesin transport system outer membrane protein